MHFSYYTEYNRTIGNVFMFLNSSLSVGKNPFNKRKAVLLLAFARKMEGSKMTIGKLIKKLRIEKKISQSELGGNQFSRSYISQIERDLLLPSEKAMHHFSKVLSISMFSLKNDIEFEIIKTNDELIQQFFLAKEAFEEMDYQRCTEVLPSVIETRMLMDRIDLMYAKKWLVCSYIKIGELEKALYFSSLFYSNGHNYTRDELSIAIELKFYQGVAEYETGEYHESLKSFLTVEEIITKQRLLADPALRINNLSMIQMVYESLGKAEKVLEYYELVLQLSKKHNIISEGYLRSVNRYYRDHSTDSIEDMVGYYYSLIKIADSIGDNYRINVLYSSITELYLKHNCISLIEQSLIDLENSDSLEKNPARYGYMKAFTELFRGRYYVKLGEYEKAQSCYTKSQECIGNVKYNKSIKLKIDSLLAYAELYLHKKELESALLYVKMSEDVSKEYSTVVRNPQISYLKEQIIEEKKLVDLKSV
ncbi:MAG: helix-turn-helix transcriptional regulator [Clostridiales bacterium]|nr:helix-turn-helix transcriptional regulator [Clostridiales bacterium]